MNCRRMSWASMAYHDTFHDLVTSRDTSRHFVTTHGISNLPRHHDVSQEFRARGESHRRPWKHYRRFTLGNLSRIHDTSYGASVVALHDAVATCHDVSFHVFEGCGSNPLLSYDTRNESKYIQRQQAFGYGLLTETTSSTPLSWAPASDVGTNTHAHQRQRRPIPWAPTATPAGSVHSKTWEFSTSK